MSNFVSRCPHCSALNRIPLEKVAHSPTCGKCKSPILDNAAIEGTSDNFDALINSEIPVVVDFWASWCGPCMSFAPIFKETAQTWNTPLRFVKLDTEVQSQLAARFAIRSIPTMKIFKQGKEIASISGALPKQQFQQWLTQSL
ncbi:thioredoxin [Vibrio ishigakensis]|uniref:Thioredoxin n=1 Tax=Vibrio ishigakensis TaxID=1481914 RepID=A0A0B8P1P1_9VIBR|nr:thioredoxin [Vibrio ishigakensis]